MIGLVGAIGAGKSQVAALLAARGAFVLDADAVGHALLTQRPVRDRVVARFGQGILQPAAGPDAPVGIDRRALGALVFNDPAARRDLEAIVHPRMRKTFERAIARAERLCRAQAIVLDAAILFEAGWNTLCDTVVYVDAPRDARIHRLATQRGWTEETLSARERVQWPADEKSRRADHVVTNDSDLERLQKAVAALWPVLLAPLDSPHSSEGTAAQLAGPGRPSRRRPPPDSPRNR